MRFSHPILEEEPIVMLSIIIPTSGREKILKRTLSSLFKGSSTYGEYEVIVVDTPLDNTKVVVESFGRDFPIRYLSDRIKSRARPRNIGAKEAKGEILLFLDDDIIVEKNFVYEHLRFHSKSETIACIGRTVHTTESEDPFINYLVKDSTFLAAYRLIEDPDDVPFNFCYTFNISIPKEDFIKVGLFDEEFCQYGLEDIEFGYRWKKAGYKIRFNPNAIGYHPFNIGKEEFIKRRYDVGRSAVLFYKKHGPDPVLMDYLHIDLAKRLTSKSELIIKKAREIIEEIETLLGDDEVFGTKGIREVLHSCYSLIIAYHYYKGIRDELFGTGGEGL